MGNYADEREWTPRVKAALVAWHLAHGEAMTTANVATLTGLDPSNAWRLMCAISVELPIYQDAGEWRKCEGETTLPASS